MEKQGTRLHNRKRNPIPQDVRKAPLSTEVGATGLNHQAGYLREEFLRELQGRKKTKVYREMSDNDAVIGAILFAIRSWVQQVEWNVEPSDQNDSQAIEQAEFVEECMHDMSSSWGSIIDENLSMLEYGYSWHELVYKQRVGPLESDSNKRSKFTDGKIGWKKMPIRAQESQDRWGIADDGGIESFLQRPAPDYRLREIPIEKSLLFRTTTRKNNPEGRSILRNAYTSWWYKSRLQEIEGIGAERDLAGVPIIRVPGAITAANASPDEAAAYLSYKELGRNIRNDEQACIILPSDTDDNGNFDYDVSLLSSPGQKQFDTNAIITRYDTRIAMTVLADFVMIGHEGQGSFALSSDKTKSFATALWHILKSIKDVYNMHAIPRLLALNGMDLTKCPMIEHSDIEKIDIGQFGEVLSKLSAGGFLTPDPDLEAHTRNMLGLPEQMDEEDFTPTPEPEPVIVEPVIEPEIEE